MDPDETLLHVRQTIEKMRMSENPAIRMGYANEIADDIEALDAWLSRGGFLPGAWRRV